MKLQWLQEAQGEFQDLLLYRQATVGTASARKLAVRILSAVEKLSDFPEMGVMRRDTRLGQYGFRALFIDRYVCIYKVEQELITIYHLSDARSNYLHRIFGVE